MKVVVWVMKPGPMADVAIRNIAPIRVDRVLAFIALSGVPFPAAEGFEAGLDGGVVMVRSWISEG